MPWLALSYDQRKINEALNTNFDCNGIPYHVAVDVKTGEMLTNRGRSLVAKHGVAFVNNAIDEKKFKAEALKRIKDLSILGSDITDEKDKSVDLSGYECVVVVSGLPHDRRWTNMVKPKLLKAYEELKDKMQVVYMSGDASESKSGPWAFIPYGTNVNLFSAVCDMCSPNLLVLSKNSTGEFEITAADASPILWRHGADAYVPFLRFEFMASHITY